MSSTMRFEDFVEINPRVSLDKGKEYPYIAMENVTPGRRYATPNTIRPFKGSGAKFQSDDILFARITPCLENGKIVQPKNVTGNVGFGSTEFFVFRARPKISDPTYVYYLTLTDQIRGPAEKSMSGASGRQRADLTAIKGIEILVPSISIQYKIASILSAYDDLIENNLRRIKILEEIVRLIYREWFVNYRFPGHEKVKMVDSELGKIPEEWKISTVEKTFSVLGGGTPSKKIPEYWKGGNVNWYTPSDLTSSFSMFMDSSTIKITELGLKKSSAKLFPQYSVMMTSRATLGVISINTTVASTNQGFITCLPNEKFPLYSMYFWLNENVDQFIRLASGATFKEITKGVFKKIKLIIPPRELLTEFENIIVPFGNQILNSQRKNSILRQTRDLLLSKLISGQMDVSELDIDVGGMNHES